MLSFLLLSLHSRKDSGWLCSSGRSEDHIRTAVQYLVGRRSSIHSLEAPLIFFGGKVPEYYNGRFHVEFRIKTPRDKKNATPRFPTKRSMRKTMFQKNVRDSCREAWWCVRVCVLPCWDMNRGSKEREGPGGGGGGGFVLGEPESFFFQRKGSDGCCCGRRVFVVWLDRVTNALLSVPAIPSSELTWNEKNRVLPGHAHEPIGSAYSPLIH